MEVNDPVFADQLNCRSSVPKPRFRDTAEAPKRPVAFCGRLGGLRTIGITVSALIKAPTPVIPSRLFPEGAGSAGLCLFPVLPSEGATGREMPMSDQNPSLPRLRQFMGSPLF